MKIARFQYITNYQSSISHFEQVKQVVEGGAKWIQFRPKETSDEEILEEGRKIASFCKKNGVTFIMNDRVDLVVELGADGVHLGKNDMSPAEARKILGDNKIIGGTANTFEDMANLRSQGVNYIGLGPFRYTTTKKNLSPVIGIEGYRKRINRLRLEKIEIPVIAIGGITEADIKPIQNTRVYGIALSSQVSESGSIAGKTKELLQITEN